MIGKYRLLIVSAILAGCLPFQSEAPAFELFPRPDGEPHVVRRSENQITQGPKNDTLADLAQIYYGNRDLWPFLMNQNPALRLKDTTQSLGDQSLPSGTRIDLYDTLNPYVVFRSEHKRPTGLPIELENRFIDAVSYRGIPYDKKFFSHKLSLRPTQVWGYIVGSPDDYKGHYLERDMVYIRFRPSKKQAILVGDRFGIFRERGPLPHPLNPDKSIGYQSDIIGEIEVVSTGADLISAIVLESYIEIAKGDSICLFTPRSREIVPSKTHRLLTGTVLLPARPDIIYGANYALENDLVFIDRGECDGMKEGMLLNFYRPAHPIVDPHFGRRILTPDVYVGEGMVLKAFDKNSTVIVTLSKEEIVPGLIIKTVSD